jgi:PII-like signaling protein
MVFLTEDDRLGHRPLADALVEHAQEAGLAGATVWRGIEGFGRSGHLRTTRFPDVARGRPLVVEVVDRPDKVASFVPTVRELAPDALLTTEAVTVDPRHA